MSSQLQNPFTGVHSPLDLVVPSFDDTADPSKVADMAKIASSDPTMPVSVVHFIQAEATRLVAKAIQFQVPKISSEVSALEVIRQDERRQKVEDVRANRRNRNRCMTLVVALLMTFMVPYLVANIFHMVWLLKYATGIAIIPDALITLYAYWRKY